VGVAAPEDELIDGVLPVPNGVVAVSDSGVFALDGVTGEETWHYRRADTMVRSANVTPDGESAVVSFSDMDVEEDARVETIVVLDGRSGEIRDEYELPSASVEDRPRGSDMSPTRSFSPLVRTRWGSTPSHWRAASGCGPTRVAVLVRQDSSSRQGEPPSRRKPSARNRVGS
jgi:hypothetical protein